MAIKRFFLLVYLFFFLTCSYKYRDKKKYRYLDINDAKKTIGYQILSVEDSSGIVDIKKSYKEFLNFIEYIRGLSKLDKRQWIKKVYDYFSMFKIKNNNFVLGIALQNKVIDCKNLCLLFYSAGQVCNIPLDIIFIREHVFLQIDSNFYFETLNGKFYKMDFYRKRFNNQLNMKIYFRKLRYDNLLSIAYENIGNYFFDKENYLLSLDFYKKALVLMPQNPSIYNNIGNAYSLLNLWNQAIENYNIALEFDPYNPNYYNNLGLLFLDIKRFKIAKRFFNEAIKFNSKKADYYANLAIALYQLKEYDSALSAINYALKLEPKEKNYYFIKSVIYFISGDYKNGEKFYKKALK